MASLKNILETHPLILAEAAIIEQLRRSETISLHPTLVNAPLIYEEATKKVLAGILQGYIDIAAMANLPFLMCSPTWRTNPERITACKARQSINTDAVQFMIALRDSQESHRENILIGGLMGCKNDCYKPDEGLSSVESEQFHTWQIDQLAGAGVDYLMAATLPNVKEATGIAKTMERTGIPYILSFVIGRDGCVLDGTKLYDAIEMIDNATGQQPVGFTVNCAYPTFLCAHKQPPALFKRLIGYQANASALDHSELDGTDLLKAEPVSDWGDAMVELNREYGVRILGGCCGTGSEHLQYIVDRCVDH
ncbi:MAG: homocysteine S-methyltransferase family protein [Desulfobacteraceae bacterium]|nr:homocysteine S-methyltransferase family protein [Desulfobacteraceae bacterium]